MSHPIIIGLTGRARVGKDTLADYLCINHGFTRLAFADPLRDALELGLGIESHHLREDKEAIIPWLGVSGRQLLQTLGTEWGRDLIRPDIWILLMQRRLAALAEEGDRFVVSDVRFPNEAAWLRARPNARLWHIERPSVAPVRAHSSEHGIDYQMGDAIIVNAILDIFFTQAEIRLADVLLDANGGVDTVAVQPHLLDELAETSERSE